MSGTPPLTLYGHPLSSFCMKTLIALYEAGTPFRNVTVELWNADARVAFLPLSPMGKIPALQDARTGLALSEASIIIEYLHEHFRGTHPLLPHDAQQRLDVRFWDRFFDLYVQIPMQKLVSDRSRPDLEKDARGAQDARATLRMAYAHLDRHLQGRTWVIGDVFTMADCSAAPALFYAGIVAPFDADMHNVTAYADRLAQRPSFARALTEARPFFSMFPFRDEIPARFLSDAA
jgi:glutathione S-transferase